MLIGWIIAAVVRWGRVLSPDVGWWLGGTFGYYFSLLPMRDQRRCREHLRIAFPDRDAQWIERTARQCFRHFGRMALWTLSTLHRSPQTLRRDCAWEGRQYFADSRAACAAGKGTLMMSGHFGNWELFCRLLGSFTPLTVLGKRMRNPAVDAFVSELRTESNSRLIYQDAGALACLRELREGRLMGTLPDQDIPRLAGGFVPWFGRLAYTPLGPAQIAAMGRAPVQLIFAFAVGRRWVLHASPRIPLNAELSREEAALDITAKAMAYQEALVRRHPEQWVWWHKRWRTRPADRPDAPAWNPGAGANSSTVPA